MKLFDYLVPTILVGFLIVLLAITQSRVNKLEQAVRIYEERQLALISQDKAIREELADLKRYIQTNEASGG
ncbi:hypothetical protein [Streptococcus ovis]|uniref:hypothetical protein n=1 Tax=Streptococcus ovis TaxID=82806 RepID=UPI000369C732|nr:hypothetical protein [Streptococcus ovis]